MTILAPLGASYTGETNANWTGEGGANIAGQFGQVIGLAVTTPGALATLTGPVYVPQGVYTIQWTVTISVATATVANNFRVYGGAAGTTALGSASVNTTAVGTTAQAAFTTTVAAGGAQLSVKSVASDATGTYQATFGSLPLVSVFPADYPFTDPVFTNFTAQQYASPTGYN
jgi:hypothetical protein